MTPIILDVDTGIDDALALILALQAEELDIKGITTVAGNVPLENTTQNTLDIVEFLGREDIPVAKGADRPLIKPRRTAGATHGATGLGGATLPHAVKVKCLPDAIGFLRKTLEDSSEKITLVPTGPLTNIAILFLAYPHVKEKIEKIVLMGGGAFEGNMNAAAEFNIYVDPEAASVVFNSGIPVVMCGLDVTNKAYATMEDIEKFKALGTKTGKFCADALEYYYNRYTHSTSLPGCAINDAVAVAYLIKPEIITAKSSAIHVDIDGVKSYGCTACDFRPDRDRSLDNGLVCLDIHREKFIDMLISACKKYN